MFGGKQNSVFFCCKLILYLVVAALNLKQTEHKVGGFVLSVKPWQGT